MASRPDRDKRTFATDLDILTNAALCLNRQIKRAFDPGEWLPDNNRCWYVGVWVWVRVKRKYNLSMDSREVDAVRRVLDGCQCTAETVPGCAQ